MQLESNGRSHRLKAAPDEAFRRAFHGTSNAETVAMMMSLINLAPDTMRWRSACAQFAAAGLNPDRLDAVHGQELTDADRRAIYSPQLNAAQYHKALRPGEIGCYASHLKAWQRLVDSRSATMAVFEDDIDIDDDLPQVLEAVARLEPECDIVKLIGRDREKIRQRAPLLGGRDLISYRRVPSLTAAYVVTRDGAKKLLAARRPFGRPVDVDMRYWWECDLRILGVHPYPVRAAPSSRTSTIEGRGSTGALPARVKKLALQVRYSALNAVAQETQPPWPSRGEGGRVPAVVG